MRVRFFWWWQVLWLVQLFPTPMPAWLTLEDKHQNDSGRTSVLIGDILSLVLWPLSR